MWKKTARHRLLSAFLSLCMVMSLFNGIAPFAETSGDIGELELYSGHVGDTLCDHTHDDACGYVEASDSTPCNHTHDDVCGYVEASDGAPCNHTHDDTCGYVEGTEGTPCDKDCTDTDDDGEIDHAEDCAYAPANNGTPCGHEHDGVCGYIAPIEGQACQHVHDDACGYKEAVEGSPCTHVCEPSNMDADTDPDKNPNEDPNEESNEEPSEDPDALLDSDLIINGKAVDAVYNWQDESGLLSMAVTFEGEILFDGEPTEEPVLALNVDIGMDEEPEIPLPCAEDEEYLYIMTLRLHLTMEGYELDISGVSAQAELNVAKETMILPQTMSLENDGDLEENEMLTTDLVVVQGGKMLDSVPYELLDMTEAAALTADPEDGSGDGSGEKENYEFNLDLAMPDQEIMLFAAVSSFSYDPNYTIQHYFWFPQVQSVQSNDGERARNRIPFINTDQGGLGFDGNPAQGVSVNNGSNNPSGKGFLAVAVDTTNGNHLTTNLVLKKLFVDEDTSYQENPQINYMSRLYNGEGEFNSNYTLSQIWVYQPDYATNTDGGPEDITNYIIYDVPWALASSLYKEQKSRVSKKDV